MSCALFLGNRGMSVVSSGKPGAPTDKAVMDKSQANGYKYIANILLSTTAVVVRSAAVQGKHLELRCSDPQSPTFTQVSA